MPLSDHPEWHYLVRDYLDLYQQGSAGGSKRIRAHITAVRRALGTILDEDPEVVAEPGHSLPVCAHLDRALSSAAPYPTARFARSVWSVREHLVWQYGYEKVPKGLRLKFGFSQILGPEGPIVNERAKLGLVLFAPKTTYPAHSHDGIEESYINISGHVSENDMGVSAPGSLIFNPPGHSHRITTADREPCLLAYAWAGDPDALASQKLKFSRKRTSAT